MSKAESDLVQASERRRGRVGDIWSLNGYHYLLTQPYGHNDRDCFVAVCIEDGRECFSIFREGDGYALVS